jgi:di/tricarboxylate transporter
MFSGTVLVLINLISIVFMPIIIGVCSGYWVMTSIDTSSSDLNQILSSVILGFSDSLIWGFTTGIIISRASGQDLGSEVAGGCLNIFVSGILGSIFAAISVSCQLFIHQ